MAFNAHFKDKLLLLQRIKVSSLTILREVQGKTIAK